MTDQDAGVQRRAEELVRAMDGSAAKQADEKAREQLTERELDYAKAMRMSPGEYLENRSTQPPEAA